MKSWYEITKEFHNIEYKKGSLDIEKGLDCFSMLLKFWESMEKDVSRFKKMTWDYYGKKVTIKNYSKIIKGIDQGRTAFKLFVEENLTKTDKLKKGCVIFCGAINNIELVGIYLGNGHMLGAFEEYGVRNIKINPKTIMEIYR